MSNFISLEVATPLEVSVFPPIDCNGATDAYEEFDEVFSEEVRDRVAAAASAVVNAVAPGLATEDVLVSCFGEGFSPDDMTAADAHKLTVPSAVPKGGFLDSGEHHDFGGDDSNLSNITERAIQVLRDERAEVGRELGRLHADGILTASAQAAGRQRVQEINAKIAGMQEQQLASAQLPVYYATPFSGLQNSSNEDNPLAYSGEIPTTSHVALYNGKAMREAGLVVTNKTDEQVRIAALGSQVMAHCIAVIHVPFVER